MRVLHKAALAKKEELQRAAIQERKVMSSCDHPFVLQLLDTFKDANCLYMLLDLTQVKGSIQFVRKTRC